MTVRSKQNSVAWVKYQVSTFLSPGHVVVDPLFGAFATYKCAWCYESSGGPFRARLVASSSIRRRFQWWICFCGRC